VAFDERAHALDQAVRLPGPGTRQNQDRTGRRLDGSALCV
jgi:hypothetical protein